MPTSVAEIKTEAASKYLQQMCKHFAHKAPAKFDTASGRVEFPFGLCQIEANEEFLTVTCESETEEQNRQMQAVIVSHLVRFAFREKLNISWAES